MDIVAQLRAEREKLWRQLNGLDTAIRALSGLGGSAQRAPRRRTHGRISAGGLANIRAAQKARWAEARRARKVLPIVPKTRKRKMSAAARRKIAASQRARWAKIKAAS